MGRKILRLFTGLTLLCFLADGAVKKRNVTQDRKGESTDAGPAIVWRNPPDIASRNLFFGPGGQGHQPCGTFTFLREDLHGTNPKYVVRDQDGVKWQVKLGAEARPETAASRLVWAIGYFTSEDYFLGDFRVHDLPVHLHRGQKLVAPDGSMHNVRLKRYLDGEEKIGSWRWRHAPFTNTREFNGLRVTMALINNWDLKDDNNAIYRKDRSDSVATEQIYMVSDLGASFGTAGPTRPHERSKGNVSSYRHSKFIRKVSRDDVDFQVPARPALVYLVNPREFLSRLRLQWIGKHIPRTDAKWIGQLLGRLSHDQIRDAFRAAGYSPNEVEAFARMVENRIAELNEL
jgi:hypothetical protein